MKTVAILAVAIFVAGCQTTSDHRPPAQEDRQVARTDKDGVQRIQVVGGSYFFRPSHIVVRANVPVELVTRREPGIAPHNLVIKAPEAGISIEEELATEPKKIAFTATRAGKYEIYCAKKPPFGASHRERGMVGTLEVVR